MDQTKILELSNQELAKLMMESDLKRAQNDELDDIYWLCVKETNRRIASGEMEK